MQSFELQMIIPGLTLAETQHALHSENIGLHKVRQMTAPNK